MECICADGSTVPPFFIFKGTGISSSTASNGVPRGSDISSSPKGWTSNIRGLMWLRDCFDPATQEKAAGKPRVLICDGHGSHVTGGFIKFFIKNIIRLHVIPPHASQLLQPLDLAVFGPLTTSLSRNFRPFSKSDAYPV